MPFPAITFCAICESVRPEVGGKLSILGFFGMTPYVDIATQSLTLPLALMVVAGFGPVDDATTVYNHFFTIINPDGSEFLPATPPSRINVALGQTGIIAIGVSNVPRVEGRRTIRLYINRELSFESQFNIRPMTPQERAGVPPGRLQ